MIAIPSLQQRNGPRHQRQRQRPQTKLKRAALDQRGGSDDDRDLPQFTTLSPDLIAHLDAL